MLVHVVMGGGIVFGSYKRPDLAFTHARCLTGTSVVALDLEMMSPQLRACVEVLEELPPEIRADLLVEWESDDITPKIVDVPIGDLDGT